MERHIKTIIIAAVTIDGKIAKHSAHNVDWTSAEDKNFFRAETKNAGVVIFGSNTYKAMGNPMPDQLNIIITQNPQLYKDKEEKGLLEFSADPPQIILDNLMQRGYNKVIIGGGNVVYSLFLEENLVDEIYITIVPKIFGTGISLFREFDAREINLILKEVNRLGEGEMLLKYKIETKTKSSKL